MTTRDRGVKDTFNLKNRSSVCLALAHSDLRDYLEKGRQSPENVFKDLKIDFRQAALNCVPSHSFSTGLV